VKLLLDENLSPRLIELLAADFPETTHIERLGMRGATDAAIWAYARANGYTIVSKDNDFRQYAFLYGPPPKVVWLSVGNAGTAAIANLVRSQTGTIHAFDADPQQSLLVLEVHAPTR
jgi:predicted nuclease of predicted toxin-antitoxin system